MKHKISNLLIVIITTALLSGCSLFSNEKDNDVVFDPVPTEISKLIVDGVMVPKQTIEILSSLNEQVETIPVEEGKLVNEGDLLLSLKGREAFQANISAAQLEISQAKNDIDTINRLSTMELDKARVNLAQSELDLISAQEAFKTYDTDEYQKKIDDARVERNNLEDDLDNANDDLDSYKDLDEDNVLRVNAENKVNDLEGKLEDSQRKLDRLVHDKEKAQSSLSLAEENVSEARFQVNQKSNGPDKTQITLLQAKLEKAQSDYDSALQGLEKVEIHAPSSGKIMHLFVDPGDIVVPGQTLVTIADVSQWFVETKDLTELDVKNVFVGDDVKLTADALPEINFSGKIEKISDWYYEKGGDIHYLVRILLTNPDPDLRWGMTFKVEFP